MYHTMSQFVAIALALLASPDSVSHEFYPVHVGDRWDYESSQRGRFSNEVVSFDGSIYSVRSTDASGRVTHFGVEVRGDSVILQPDRQDERLLVDFGAPLGGSFIASAGSAAEIVTFMAEHENFEVLGRTFSRVREYRHKGEAGLEYSSYFAEGIGLVGMQWTSGVAVRLLGAHVARKSVE
jgi:hypothetical protein